jgi:hypothetical protein
VREWLAARWGWSACYFACITAMLLSAPVLASAPLHIAV